MSPSAGQRRLGGLFLSFTLGFAHDTSGFTKGGEVPRRPNKLQARSVWAGFGCFDPNRTIDSIDIPVDFINDAYQAILLDCLVEPRETAGLLHNHGGKTGEELKANTDR